MEALTFFSAMNRGQFREEQGIEGSSYCIFFAPMEELVTQDRMTGREDRVVLELLYGDEMLPGALRVRQVGSNAVVEESTQGAFRAFLEEKPVKYIGQLLMYALQFLGYQIPKDVSVVGFDDIPASERITPALTTIHTPKKYLGIAAARQMLERIQYPDSPRVYSEYATELIIRDSTR